jgi:hypothetical protein
VHVHDRNRRDRNRQFFSEPAASGLFICHSNSELRRLYSARLYRVDFLGILLCVCDRAHQVPGIIFFNRLQTFEMYDNLMNPLVSDMESVLEFLPGTLVFRNDTCVTSGVCANSNFTPKSQVAFTITFSATGPLVTGHLWNLNFQAQTMPKWSGKNSLPSCPSIVTCTMGA